MSVVFRPLEFISMLMCVQPGDLSGTSLQARKRAGFVVAVRSKISYAVVQKKLNSVKSRGGKGADASQTGMGREAEFSGLGLQ